jgi:hypothetical protein
VYGPEKLGSKYLLGLYVDDGNVSKKHRSVMTSPDLTMTGIASCSHKSKFKGMMVVMYATKVGSKSQMRTSRPIAVGTPLIGGRVVAPTKRTVVIPTTPITGPTYHSEDGVKYLKGRITNVSILSDPKLFIPRTGLTNLVDGP